MILSATAALSVLSLEESRMSQVADVLTDSFFEPALDTCSLHETEVDAVVDQTQSFPTLSARNHREGAIRTQCLHLLKGDWPSIDRAFVSKVVYPGTVLMKPHDKQWCCFVLYTSKYGCLAVRSSMKAFSKCTALKCFLARM
eukprot:5898235-Amphidinium_carterae.2